jgi:ABC-2 type transport system permease protein
LSVATWRASKAIAWRHLYKWISLPANFLPTFLFPLLFFSSFAGSLAIVGDIPGFDYEAGYTSFIFIFSLLQTCAFGGMATGFTIAGDFESGFAQRLMLVMQNRRAILYGSLISTFVRAVIMSGVVTLIGFFMGLRMLGSPGEIVVMYLMAFAMSFIGTLWSSGVMFRGRSAQVAPAMQVPMFLAIFLAPVYVPYDMLTGWIHNAATYNPFTYLMESMRGLLAGYYDHLALAAICIAAMFVVLGLWSLTGLRSAERAG